MKRIIYKKCTLYLIHLMVYEVSILVLIRWVNTFRIKMQHKLLLLHLKKVSHFESHSLEVYIIEINPILFNVLLTFLLVYEIDFNTFIIHINTLWIITFYYSLDEQILCFHIPTDTFDQMQFLYSCNNLFIVCTQRIDKPVTSQKHWNFEQTSRFIVEFYTQLQNKQFKFFIFK